MIIAFVFFQLSIGSLDKCHTSAFNALIKVLNLLFPAPPCLDIRGMDDPFIIDDTSIVVTDLHGTVLDNQDGALRYSSFLPSLILTHYHKMPHSDALMRYRCGKHCEKRRN